VASGGEVSLRGHPGPVRFAAFSADGSRVVTAGPDGSARLWDARSGAALGSFPWHAVWLGAVALSADGRRLATVVDDHDIDVLDVGSGARVAHLAGSSLGFAALAFNHSGSRLSPPVRTRRPRCGTSPAGGSCSRSKGTTPTSWSPASAPTSGASSPLAPTHHQPVGRGLGRAPAHLLEPAEHQLGGLQRRRPPPGRRQRRSHRAPVVAARRHALGGGGGALRPLHQPVPPLGGRLVRTAIPRAECP